MFYGVVLSVGKFELYDYLGINFCCRCCDDCYEWGVVVVVCGVDWGDLWGWGLWCYGFGVFVDVGGGGWIFFVDWNFGVDLW